MHLGPMVKWDLTLVNIESVLGQSGFVSIGIGLDQIKKNNFYSNNKYTHEIQILKICHQLKSILKYFANWLFGFTKQSCIIDY